MTEGDNPKNLPARVAGMNEVERLAGAGDRLPATRVPTIYGGGAGRSESSLRDIFFVLFRHKWKIVLTFLILTAATVLYVSSIPQMFESEARIYIRGERTGLTVDPTAEGNSFLKGSRDGSSVRSEIGIIQSQVLAEAVVNKLGAATVLGFTPKPKEAPPQSWAASLGLSGRTGRTLDAIQAAGHTAMKKMHLVDPKMTPDQAATQDIVKTVQALPTMSESYVLRVTYQNSSPAAAQKVLDALLDAYQQQHINIHKVGVSPEFFQAKIDELRKQLAEKENSLEAERKRLNITSLEGQKTMLLNQFNTFDTALKENAMSITSLKAKIAQLDTMLSRRQNAPTGKSSRREVARSNPVTDQLRGRLLELRLKESDMATRYTDANPMLIDVRNQIKQIEKLLSGEASKMPGMDLIADAVDGPSQEIELQGTLAKVELEAENAREGTLIKALNDVRKDLDTLMGNEKSLKQLERDVDILENEYRQYLKSMQVADISSALDKDKISNVSILQRATLPAEPVKSQRKLLALLGFGIFLSLLGGIGWAFGLEWCDHSVKTSEDVEKKLGLPVLVALPYNKRHKPLMLEANS